MEYSLQRQDAINSSISSSNILELSELFCNHCSWLNRLIMWSSMWTPYNASNKCRSKCINIIGITISIVSYIYWIISTAMQNKYDTMYNETLMIYIMTLIVEYTYYILKLLSLYYFLKIFDYPWNNMVKLHSYDIDITDYASKRLKSTNIRLKLLFPIYLGLCIYFDYFIEFSKDSEISSYGKGAISNKYAQLFSTLFIIEIPLIISQFVLTIIFLKYEMYLYGLRGYIFQSNHKEIDFETLIKEYGGWYNKFCFEYKIFQLLMGLSFVGIFGMVWLFISSLIHYTQYVDIVLKFNGLSVLILAMPFIEFVISATYLTNEYDKLRTQLTKFDDYKLELVSDSMDDVEGKDIIKMLQSINGYHCFIIFVSKYPICAQLIGWRVSITNCFRFLCFFIVAKGISYAIYYI